MFINNDETIPEGEEALWMTREEVAKVCPPCAEKMQNLGILRIRATVLFNETLAAAVLDGQPPCVDCQEDAKG